MVLEPFWSEKGVDQVAGEEQGEYSANDVVEAHGCPQSRSQLRTYAQQAPKKRRVVAPTPPHSINR